MSIDNWKIDAAELECPSCHRRYLVAWESLRQDAVLACRDCNPLVALHPREQELAK